MSEPADASNALFGVDGTELPEPLPVLPDPLTGVEREPWLDAPMLPLVPMPAMPDVRLMREAISAALGGDPTDPSASPSPYLDTSASETGPVPHPGAQQAGVGGSAYRRPLPRPVGETPVRGRTAPGPHVPEQPRAFKPIPPPTDLRRRIGQHSAGQLQTRSSGGVRTGCVVLIIFGVVAVTVIIGIVQTVSALF